MAWLPIAQTLVQYSVDNQPATGYVLKFYAAGTSTNIVLATDSTGGTTATDIVLDSQGYPSISNTPLIPHIDQKYKIALYPSQAAADADSGAVWTQDNIEPTANTAISTQSKVTVNDTTAGYLDDKIVDGTNITTTLVNSGGNETLSVNLNSSISGALTLQGAVTMDSTLAVTGGVSATGNVTANKSIYTKKGADIASANDAVLLADGNYNDITGTTTINGFTDGVLNETRKFHTDAVTTLKHNTAASVGFSSLWLPGEVDLATTANLELEFTYDGTLWRLTGIVQDLYIPTQHGGDYIKLSDVKAANTAGGTFTSGAWRTRDLNTEDTDTGGYCTLSSNQFTLAAGDYIIRATAPARGVNRHKAKLVNISDTSDELIGSTELSIGASGTASVSTIVGLISYTTSKTFEIQHRCETTRATYGFGSETNFADEVYTIVELWKVK